MVVVTFTVLAAIAGENNDVSDTLIQR